LKAVTLGHGKKEEKLDIFPMVAYRVSVSYRGERTALHRRPLLHAVVPQDDLARVGSAQD